MFEVFFRLCLMSFVIRVFVLVPSNESTVVRYIFAAGNALSFSALVESQLAASGVLGSIG